jgi:hypothetical protein
LQLDQNFKKLIKELGNAINESLAESESISEVMGRIRAAGYDLFLVLEVTIGFNKRGEDGEIQSTRLDAGEAQDNEFRLTNQDEKFLRGLKISIEKEDE